ncbi:MAG: L,D-transpeptidase family protein [Verrucomicrobiales bacterium]
MNRPGSDKESEAHGEARRALGGFARVLRVVLALVAVGALCNCASTNIGSRGRGGTMVVNTPEQTLTLFDKQGDQVKVYPVSTSKFGLGDKEGSYRTPYGRMEVAKMIGTGAKRGTVFKGRKPTGEVIKPNAPGRDPIVTRIIWLRGTEDWNANAYSRCIYIHGTPEENRIGVPASYGCIRMRSKDIVDLFDRVGPGTDVIVTEKPLVQRRRSVPEPKGGKVASASPRAGSRA